MNSSGSLLILMGLVFCLCFVWDQKIIQCRNKIRLFQSHLFIYLGVVAYAEVRSTNDNRSKAICDVLLELGATVVKKFTNEVTHVIFKEGTKRTKTKAQKKGVHLVSVLWVDRYV